MGLWEVLGTDQVDVSVKDSGGNKECLWFIFFLHVKVEDLLDTVGAVICCDLLINVLFLLESALNLLADRHLVRLLWLW